MLTFVLFVDTPCANEAIIYMTIACDYDQLPLLPGEAIEININLENLNLDGTIFVNLDIYVIGIST